MQTRKVGNYVVEAMFTKEGHTDGIAKYFDESHRLISKINYENGIRSGKAINYYENGHIMDSLFYGDDKEYGYWYHFDSMGNIAEINNYYYGITVGASFFYESGVLKKFLFTDFNQTTLADCDYQNGKIIDLKMFKMNPVLVNETYGGRNVKKLFAYLPHIPMTDQKFMIGITNDKKQDKELGTIYGNGTFIDTLLPNPNEGWRYYIACHLKSTNDSINKFFLTEINDE